MGADVINGLFEICGAIFLSFNIKALWRDRQVKGVSLAPFIFYTAWGLWNLYFYPAYGLVWSFVGGIAVVLVNAAWLFSVWIIYLQNKRKPKGCPKHPVGTCICEINDALDTLKK